MLDEVVKSFQYDSKQDAEIVGGYPQMYSGGIVPSLSFVEISVESVRYFRKYC